MSQMLQLHWGHGVVQFLHYPVHLPVQPDGVEDAVECGTARIATEDAMNPNPNLLLQYRITGTAQPFQRRDLEFVIEVFYRSALLK